MHAEPLAVRSERIELIDVIRGVTLFGIILVHMVEQYYAGMLPEEYSDFSSKSIADQIVTGFVSIFITGKFYMLFSFLFGLSFYIQLSKTSGDRSFLVRFAWRIVILFIIGFIHHLHYRGDILTIYAFLGFGLMILSSLPDRYILVLGILLVANVPSVIARFIDLIWTSPEQGAFADQDQESLMLYFNTFKSGSYVEILNANLHSFKDKMYFQILSGRIYITLGLFLLGLYAGRKKIFEELPQYLPRIKKANHIALWTILACVVFALLFFSVPAMLGISIPEQAQWLAGGFIYDVFNATLAFLYVNWIILLFQKQSWRNRLMHFYAPGRMGLTVYLMQTFFGLLIYSSVGLGLLAEIDGSLALAIAILIFLFQIWFSKVWLSKFEYGFFEWIWRSATNLKVARLAKPHKIPANE